METQGYVGHERFNKLAGDRLIYADPNRGRRVDVFFDRIEMCHTLDLRTCLSTHPETPPLAELLLTKLQIAKLTDRDIVDVAALLSDHPLGDGDEDPEAIDVSTIGSLCGADWGWWRTVTGNLRAMEERWRSADGGGPGPDPGRAAARAAELRGILDAAPKTLRWKARAVVGDRVTWYQEPEEVS